MVEYKKIIVPADGSENGKSARSKHCIRNF